MAIIKFRCPFCEQKCSVSVEHAGKMGSCPKCAELIEMPAENAEEFRDEMPGDTDDSQGIVLGDATDEQ